MAQPGGNSLACQCSPLQGSSGRNQRSSKCHSINRAGAGCHSTLSLNMCPQFLNYQKTQIFQRCSGAFQAAQRDASPRHWSA